MNLISEARKTYQAHRENQRERILEAAEELFIRDGVDNVSMEAIAKATRLARKTLYEYFSNKLEIALAVIQSLLDKMAADFEPTQLPESNGFQRIEAFVQHLIGLLDAHPEFFRFLVEFDTLYAREGDPTRVRQMFAQSSELLIPMIQQGIADGSIRPDVDPHLLSAALFNLVSGMHSRFALLGHQIREEYGYPVMELYREICHCFLRGIQNTPASRKDEKLSTD